jgi:hypothetical protein
LSISAVVGCFGAADDPPSSGSIGLRGKLLRTVGAMVQRGFAAVRDNLEVWVCVAILRSI